MNTLTLTHELDQEILKISKALATPTRYNILKLLGEGEKDISEIAQRLGLTEANISAQVKHLEKVHLLESRYEPGSHGVRKICAARYDAINIKLNRTNPRAIKINSQ